MVVSIHHTSLSDTTALRVCRDQVKHYCQEKLMPRILMANREERKLGRGGKVRGGGRVGA